MRAEELKPGDVVKMDNHVAKVLDVKQNVNPDLLVVRGWRVRNVMQLAFPLKADLNGYIVPKQDEVVRMAWLVIAGNGAWLPVTEKQG